MNIESNFPSSKNILVDFLVCGTQKGGTTALDCYLRQHKQICMANVKEVHFFDRDVYFPKNKVANYDKYHAFFSLKKHHKVVGESTPIYMYWLDAPKRIWEYNPDMKIIIILRNPIERAYSHWNMACIKGKETLSFFDAIKDENKRYRQSLPKQHRIYSYVERGFYLEQLRRLWFFFSKKNVLVLKNEDLRGNHLETLESVCKFLNIESFSAIPNQEKHSREYEYKITKDEINYLRNIYEYEIKSLERELNWNCSNWLEQQ